MSSREFIIKDTHRGLRYRDGILEEVLGAGRYRIPRSFNLGFWRRPKVEIQLVDVRERDLTIKGQEILTADKVAIRVSIVVRFRVVDPKAALHEVENYEDRLYTDVQLAARRSLASTTLEDILTNRNRLSDDILKEIKESAVRYGVEIRRADVKDLIFPGNLQEIMNRVLASERRSQAELVDARTEAQAKEIAAQANATTQRLEAAARADARRLEVEAELEANRKGLEAELQGLKELEKAVAAYEKHPALLRLEEIRILRELARNGTVQVHFGYDRLHSQGGARPDSSAPPASAPPAPPPSRPRARKR